MHSLTRSVPLVVVALLLILPGGPAAAKGAPPAIGDLIGTWTMSASGQAISTVNGVGGKFKDVSEWSMTAAGGDLLTLGNAAMEIELTAKYYAGSGILAVAANSQEEGELAARVGYALVSGSAAKVKLKGEIYLADLADPERVQWMKFKGTRTGPVSAAKPAAAGIREIRSKKSAPAVADLDGAVLEGKISMKGFGLEAGDKGSESSALRWTLTDQGGGVIDLASEESDGTFHSTAYYVNGLLFLGEGDDDVFATEAVVAVMFVSGTPGKLRVKGLGMELADNGEDDYVAALKISLKQVQ